MPLVSQGHLVESLFAGRTSCSLVEPTVQPAQQSSQPHVNLFQIVKEQSALETLRANVRFEQYGELSLHRWIEL